MRNREDVPGERALAALAGLGGFFVLTAPAPAGSDAVPWSQVLGEETLAARFATVRAALAQGSGLPVGEVDAKVAVSATQVGLASRLWSVALASVVLEGWLPDLSSADLVASPVHRGAVPLGVLDPGRGTAVASPAEAVDVIARQVVGDSLAALDDACSRVGATPRRVLSSNSASALVGAARVLSSHRPDRAADAWALARLLLADPRVAEGGRAVPRETLPAGVGGGMEHPEEAFLRDGCCVFYRLPGHGLCPDCVLAPSRAEQVTPSH